MVQLRSICQLCGVAFLIARIRRPDEPFSAAWDSNGTWYIHEYPDDVERFCKEIGGCQMLSREPHQWAEHVAGPGCASYQGYSGHRISVEEMKGCRAIQFLVKKTSDWETEDDDQKFEIESDYFLTGTGNGLPDETLLNLSPTRHGIDSISYENIVYYVS